MEEEGYISKEYMELRKFSDIMLPIQTDLPRKRIQVVEATVPVIPTPQPTEPTEPVTPPTDPFVIQALKNQHINEVKAQMLNSTIFLNQNIDL